MRILVLGSAAGGGFPQWNCNCDNCGRVRRGDRGVLARTQSSLAVSADGASWLLLNASPDLRQQIAAQPALHPRARRRDSPIAAVALTNGDVDHVAGLLSLREGHAFSLYAPARVLAALRRNPIFGVLDLALVGRRDLPLDRPLAVEGGDGRPIGLSLSAFPVPGKVALWLEDPEAGPGLGTEPGDTVGFEVAGADGARFFYIPGCAALTPGLAARLQAAPLVLFDGTLWRDDEMIRAGLGAKTGRRMGHMSLSGPEGTIAAFDRLGVARKVAIHVNNTNPVLLPESPERARLEAAGWELAFDGMEIRL